MQRTAVPPNRNLNHYLTIKSNQIFFLFKKMQNNTILTFFANFQENEVKDFQRLKIFSMQCSSDCISSLTNTIT